MLRPPELKAAREKARNGEASAADLREVEDRCIRAVVAMQESVGLEAVTEIIFNAMEVDGFFLEYDDERSGDFAPLRFVPKDKIIVLGLVTSKRGALEDRDLLKRRIDEAARYVPLDQLCLSPQCGFSSNTIGNRLTAEDQTAKLRLVVEVAAEVWG